MRKLLVPLVALFLPAASEATTDLLAFLREVETAARATVALRADGRLSVTVPDRTTHDQVVLLQRETGDLYVELRQAGEKALVTKMGAEAFILIRGAKEPKAFAFEDALASSDFTREDLQPFVMDRYHTPRIVDESAEQLVVSMFPTQSQYSLVVFTFVREKKAPIKTLYYRETLNNLVKMRRDRDHVLVGGRWLPTTITMQNIPLRTESRLHLRWTTSPPLAPSLFLPASLTRPSGLTWPESTAPP